MPAIPPPRLWSTRWECAFLGGAVDAVQPGQLNSENFPIKKQNRAQGLVVRGSRHLAVGGEMRQKRLNVAGTHVARVPHGPAMARPANEEANPVDVHLLSAEAVVHVPDTLAQLVQNPGGLQHQGAGFDGIFITGHPSSILSGKLGCKPLSGGTHDQLMEQPPTYRAGFALDITLANQMSKKVGVILGSTAILIGLAVIASGKPMCRTSCWMDGVFRLLLPERLDYLAIGLPSIIIGIGVIFHALWAGRK